MSLPGLPPGVSSRRIDNGNGLVMHVLEAGPEDAPLLLLLHGFPELAYSWRKVMPLLAAAGHRVVAPDQRGYGLTTGWTADYDDDLAPYRMTNLVTDALGLVTALGRTRVTAVIGHDFGSPVAAWCGLIRPDVFRAVVMMSAPFAGPPSLPRPAPDEAIHRALAALPRPRKHYQGYYATRAADADMRYAPQGLAAFLRAYYHVKSADWPDNRPHPLPGWTAEALATLPTYYVMDRDRTMAETVAPHAPSPEEAAACSWLTEAELAVYAESFARTGFQGGLDWYRCGVDPEIAGALALFSGRRIDVPATFVAGAADWGVYQVPGAFEAMATRASSDFRGATLIEGAGHWVQQEQPERTAAAVLAFLEGCANR
ncbi:alpha/beta hydrolase [Salinarimonas sp.]|uniref:alpha/beta hydrolase n=1 Tax=Salinarimonas sp. TaxID=2766526 RepID=UPI0032D8F24E